MLGLTPTKKFVPKGYFLEYFVNGKYYGTRLIDEPDRDQVGYYSKRTEVAAENIKLQQNRTIKKGTEFVTRMYPLCGKAYKDTRPLPDNQ